MKLNEVEIEVKHSGLLEVPAGKEVDQLPQSHFQKLIDKKGYEAIIRGLTNLEVWNKNKNPKLSQWASNMADKLKKANNKDESLSNKLFEMNAKLAKKIGDKVVKGAKKVGQYAKETVAKSADTARNAIVAGAVAPVGAGIAQKYTNKPKKKDQKYTSAEVAALATAMKNRGEASESLSKKLFSHLSILEKEEKKESGAKKVVKGAAQGAGIGLAGGAAGGAVLGRTVGKALTGGLKGKVASGVAGAAAKGVRGLTTTAGAVGGGALGLTRGLVGGALLAGGKHLYDKHKANKETSKKNESLIEALDRLKSIYEEEGIPKKKRILTPEQKARRQERRKLRRQLEKQGVIQKKPRSSSVKTIQGEPNLAKSLDNIKNSQEASKVAADNASKLKTASQKTVSDGAKKLSQTIKSTAKGNANKTLRHSQALKRVLNKAAFKGGLKGAAITAGVGAAGLAAKKMYDKNKKK